MPTLGPFSLERMVSAGAKVRHRLRRVAAALENAQVPYAVMDDHAVALRVSRVDESAVRNTRDVDVMVRRSDFDAVKSALALSGFVHRHVAGMEVFLEGPNAKPREGVHVIFANEKVREHDALPNPDVDDSERLGNFASSHWTRWSGSS